MRALRILPLLAPAALFLAGPAWAEEAAAPHLDGAALSLAWAAPFAGILLSIAVGPLLAPGFWHHHYGKVVAAWALAYLAPLTLAHGSGLASYQLVHVALSKF